MNGRSAVATFVLFLFLSAVVLLQILSRVQSDRLIEPTKQTTFEVSPPLEKRVQRLGDGGELSMDCLRAQQAVFAT